MRKIAFWFQLVGVLLISAGIAAVSVPAAAVVVGVLLIAAGEVHG
jgi:uncharacterized membrane protein HdeD (DUF308 family)